MLKGIINIGTKLLLLAITFLLVLSSCGRSPINVLFVAGPNDHCGDLPCHRYIEDLQFLKNCLDTIDYSSPITTMLLVGQRPNLKQLKSADILVIHSSADRKEGEWHALFPTNNEGAEYTNEEKEYLLAVDRAMQNGLGLVSLHYTNWVDHPFARSYYSKWLGGYFLRRQSKVKADFRLDKTTAVTKLNLATPDHPIFNGVNAWTTEAEYYYQMYLEQDSSRRTPLLYADLPVDNPTPQLVAWALDRNGGGRSIGFTGGHFHKNMALEDYRTFLLNAIIWAGKGKIPASGMKVSGVKLIEF